MTLSEGFVLAAGSVTGRDHRRAQRDGQDGFALRASTKADVVAAVVTDGCSSGRTSEVGARLGAAWIAGLIEQRFALVADEDAARVAAQRVVEGLVERLRDLAASLGADAQIVGEMLLFGFLAIAITKEVTIVFGVGDGAAAIDGAVTVIDPGPDNAPAYAAYALLGTHIEPRVLFVGSAEWHGGDLEPAGSTDEGHASIRRGRDERSRHGNAGIEVPTRAPARDQDRHRHGRLADHTRPDTTDETLVLIRPGLRAEKPRAARC
jgi:hypothetical protein